MLICIGGYLGSGKTLFATILGKLMVKNDKLKMYSNYKTSFSELKNPLELLDFTLENCGYLFDEAYTVIDSRNSSTTLNKLFSYFFLQSRKRKVYVITIAQLLGSLDTRLRTIADRYILAQRKEDKNGDLLGFKYKFYIHTHYIGKRFLSRTVAEKFYKDYNTEEIILPFLIQTMSIDTIEELFKDTPTKKSFTVVLRSDYPNITMDSANALYDLLKHGYKERAQKLLKRI
jgi:hypothetical protein